jgi:hypothetical protein
VAQVVNETNLRYAEGIGGHAADDMMAVVGPGHAAARLGKDKVVLSLGRIQQAAAGNARVPCRDEATSLFRGLKEARHN